MNLVRSLSASFSMSMAGTVLCVLVVTTPTYGQTQATAKAADSPPEAGSGHRRQGARHVSEIQLRKPVIGIDIGKNSFHVRARSARCARRDLPTCRRA